MRLVIHAVLGLSVVLGTTSCRPSEVLNVPPPSGEFASSSLQGQIAIDAEFNGAKAQMFTALAGDYDLLEWSGLLTDEGVWSYFNSYSTLANVDARFTAASTGGKFNESGDAPLALALQARASLLMAEAALRPLAAQSEQVKVGESYALVGYLELFLAEDYCAGVPLSQALLGGGWQYEKPLSTDSLLGTAEAHFDTALAHASSSDTVTYLASIGLARTRLNRGNDTGAVSALVNVPTNFVYNTELEPGSDQAGTFNLYSAGSYCSEFNTGDREGVNGMNFVSAHDPRLVLDSTMVETCDGKYAHVPDSLWYYPVKFGNPSTFTPLATGIEARLIEAEAALAANQPSLWLNDLNTLRNATCRDTFSDTSCTIGTGRVVGQTTGLQPLTDPGTDTGRVSLMFRERAFWLFGTGTRLGDLRRMIRQYQRPAESVFPTGAYAPGNDPLLSPYLAAPMPTYGTDVNLTLPTPASGTTTANPYYKGCITPTTTA